MFLIAFMEYTEMPKKVTIVVKDEKDIAKVPCQLPVDTIVRIQKQPTEEYPLLNDRTTYYICEGHSCKAPSNELSMD